MCDTIGNGINNVIQLINTCFHLVIIKFKIDHLQCYEARDLNRDPCFRVRANLKILILL